MINIDINKIKQIQNSYDCDTDFFTATELYLKSIKPISAGDEFDIEFWQSFLKVCPEWREHLIFMFTDQIKHPINDEQKRCWQIVLDKI